jgi:hypothetical protein|tara:strand:- start:249 stop:494 length:246 start_codon:yes stop_codon:yes gene_type:complete
MSDFEYDAENFPWDEDQTVVIATKLKNMFDNIQKVVDFELMKFTSHELEILETVYGTKLVYPIYPDLEKALSSPKISRLLH